VLVFVIFRQRTSARDSRGRGFRATAGNFARSTTSRRALVVVSPSCRMVTCLAPRAAARRHVKQSPRHPARRTLTGPGPVRSAGFAREIAFQS